MADHGHDHGPDQGHPYNSITSTVHLPHLPSAGPNRNITFYGQAFSDPSNNLRFDVLAGDMPPRIVGGYGKWQVIDRPLRRGLTVFQGYDPISMEVHVRFIRFDSSGSWLQDNSAGLAIEEDIGRLEWMSGEGWELGPPPLVWLTTFDGSGNTIPLIPFEYQTTTPSVPKFFGGGDSDAWVVVGLAWDENPIRNAGAYRIRQDATVTVQFYSSLTSPPTRGKTARPKGKTVVSRAGADTALKIARQQPTTAAPVLAVAIKNAPQNKRLQLRSINTPIKHGKKVYIPPGG